MLPIDFTLNGANNGAPQVRTVMHVHGAHVGPESDGGPEAWFTRGFRQTGPDFVDRVNYYPNSQAAATLWYHDHAMGITRLNVYAGLAGFFLVRDAFEDGLNLPKGRYEIPLAIQDRSLNLNGSLFYPDSRYFFADPEFPTPIPPDMPPVWNPEFFGNLMVTNGKIWPFHRVEPRKYRLRLLNGCDSRFLVLKFDDATGLTFTQIGTDGGFLPAPVTVNQIIMGPGERADVIVDFSGFTGASLILRNIAPDEPFGGVLPDPLNPDAPLPADPATTGQVMEFRVTQRLSGPDTSVIPGALVPAQVFGAPTVRDVTLNELVSATFDAPIAARLGDANGGLPFDAPITENPASGATEIWRIINLTADTHPIHLHLVQFLILDRTPFDPALYVPGDLDSSFTGPAVAPDANELGPKDTIRANPGEVTRIIAKFDLPADVATPAKYVWHCHILSHEDNEMMRPYEVVTDV
jgi:spore coat protein A